HDAILHFAQHWDSFEIFNEFRLQGKLCDVVIRADNVEFNAHKVVLCGCSPYFRALFNSHWTKPEKKLYNIPGLSSYMMHLIIEFAYTLSVPVTEENVEELLAAADQFNIQGALDTCCEFLGQQLCPENCIGIWKFVDIYNCLELKFKAYMFILQHFEEVATFDEFLQLSVEELADIIQRDDLNAKQESTVFEAIVRWISHSHEDRKYHIRMLLSKVRLALMSSEYFMNNVKNHALVKDSSECRHTIISAMSIMFFSHNRGSYSAHQNLLSRPRWPYAVLVAIGGWSGDRATNSIEAYDPRADRWVSVTNNEEHPRAYHGAAVLNGMVYCIGGFDGSEYFSKVRKFDLGTCIYHDVAPMHSARCYVSVAVLNGCIYAMGGYDGLRRLNTAERYEPHTNQWTLLAAMHEDRSDASATTLHGKAYNPAINAWHATPSMMNSRSNFGIGVVDDLLFVVGGFNGLTTTCNVERYDDSAGKWIEAHDMKISRSAISCCVVHRFPNFNMYALEDAQGSSESVIQT
uniref:Kelch like family member 10 n=1 Tax=Myripristis murdjan TaxID=586833 RepID=A0A667Z8R5_9TELE